MTQTIDCINQDLWTQNKGREDRESGEEGETETEIPIYFWGNN